LYGKRIQTTDGVLGHINDFYIDDRNWVIRYVVADTSAWRSDRLVLLAPSVFAPSPLNGPYCNVKLTSQQVQASPPIALHKPISRQFEEEHYRAHGWPDYWKGDGLSGLNPTTNGARGPGYDEMLSASGDSAPLDDVDAHLRSARVLCGYQLHTAEGTLGHVRDFIVDEDNWSISHLVVETGNWLSGKEIVISIKEIVRINYDESLIFVRVKKDRALKSPEYALPSNPSSLFAGKLPLEKAGKDLMAANPVENKDQVDPTSTFTLFPEACPTGDTSGFKPPLADLVKKRAYELFEQSGRINSSALQNWLRAEREVKHHLGI